MAEPESGAPARHKWSAQEKGLLVLLVAMYIAGSIFVYFVLPDALFPHTCSEPNLLGFCLTDDNFQARGLFVAISSGIFGAGGLSAVVFIMKAVRSAARLSSGRTADFNWEQDDPSSDPVARPE